MELQLVDGVFNQKDIIDIVSKMVDVKIKFHESKIENSANEDDIKMREKKIKQLQEELYNCRNSLSKQDNVQVSAHIFFNS